MEFDALALDLSKENSYFSPRGELCTRMAMAKSRFGAFSGGPPFWEGGKQGSQARNYYYYYKQKGAHFGGGSPQVV